MATAPFLPEEHVAEVTSPLRKATDMGLILGFGVAAVKLAPKVYPEISANPKIYALAGFSAVLAYMVDQRKG